MWKFLLPIVLHLLSQTHGSYLEEEMVQLKLQMKDFLGEFREIKAELRTVERDLELTRTENRQLKERVDKLTQENRYISNHDDTTKDSGYSHVKTVLKKNISQVHSEPIAQRIYKDYSKASESNFERKSSVPNSENPDSVDLTTRQRRLLLQTESRNASDIQKVAFAVGLTKSVQLGNNQPVEYDKVFTNVGNAYDSRHGHFTAPVKGVYLFSFTVLNHTGDTVYLEMVKNGKRIAIVYMHAQDRSLGSQTTVAVLEKGDMVWVRHTNGGTPTIDSYPGEWYNSFSGTILFEI